MAIINGTNGDDRIRDYANQPGNTVNGLAGNDDIAAAANNDTLNGDDGNDLLQISGRTGVQLNGGNGQDVFQLSSNELNGNFIDGGSGFDVLALSDFFNTGQSQTPSPVPYDIDVDNVNFSQLIIPGISSINIQNVESIKDFYGSGGNDTIRATGTGDNTIAHQLYGGSGNDLIVGGAGNDLIYDLIGQDTLTGGAGNDEFVVGLGGSTVNGGDGNDRVVHFFSFRDNFLAIREGYGDSPFRSTTVNGGAGNDEIFLVSYTGTPAVTVGDAVDGGEGNDNITGSRFSDTLNGGADNDTIQGSGGQDLIDGGGGDDLLYVSNNSTVRGGAGNDFFQADADVIVGDRNDRMEGGEGFDVLDTWDLSKSNVGSTFDLSNLNALIGVESVANFTAGSGNDTVVGAVDLAFYGFSAKRFIDTGAGNDQVAVVSGNTTINSGDGDDTVVGGTGNDIITDRAGNNRLAGGAGNDIFVVSATGNNQLDGGAGIDVLATEVDVSANSSPVIADLNNFNFTGLTIAGISSIANIEGVAELKTGSANDQLTVDAADRTDRIINSGKGDDSITTGAGNDYLAGADGNDTITGNAGFDTIFGENGRDFISGGDNNDLLLSGNDQDTVDGGTGEDYIAGGSGDDLLEGGLDNDTVHGEQGNDSINGGAGTDFLYGGDNEDSIDGGAAEDIIGGGLGDDSILGSEGDDKLWGEDGNDTVSGGEGDDRIFGNQGNNLLLGGADNDTIVHLEGNDTITGGAGIDSFFIGLNYLGFDQLGKATITDFVSGTDKILLHGQVFNQLPQLEAGVLPDSVLAIVTTDNEVATSNGQLVYNQATGTLFYNANGAEAGLGGGGSFAQLAANTTITAQDFNLSYETY
jgi:Ca2+-binding RTX toxin-like protein